MSSRRRPLHTCAVSFMAIAHKAYTKVQDFNGPLGSMTKKIARLASLASQLVYPLQCQLLAILAFIDDRILGVENMVEAFFHPSRIVFDKVDELVHIAETLPAKFDDAVNKLPAMIHQVPFLDWAVVCAITWLNFWVSILTHWGSGSTKEKEIVIDSINESAIVQEADDTKESQNNGGNEVKEDLTPMSVTSGAESETETLSPKIMKATYKDALEKVTYKDALEKGTKENMQKKEYGTEEKIQEPNVSKEDTNEEGTKEKLEKGGDCRKKTKNSNVSNEETGKGKTGMNIKKKEDDAEEETKMYNASMEATWEGGDKSSSKMNQSISEDDPILALFESAWLMKPGEKGKGSSVPRSVSYQW